jgi:Fe2+ or Zn2+ uptake regulation protein
VGVVFAPGRRCGRHPVNWAAYLTLSRKAEDSITVMPISPYAELLRTADMRVTRPRVAVLEVVGSNPHADTDTILGLVRSVLPEVSRQTVYDVLNALTAARLVRRIEPAGSPARYESRVGDNHHHAVCRSCGVIADVDCAVGETPCLTASDSVGFTIDEAEVIYWGFCAQCSTARGQSTAPVSFPPGSRIQQSS